MILLLIIMFFIAIRMLHLIPPVIKEDCKLHKWKNGKCEECGFIAGTHKTDQGEYGNE